MSFHWQAIQIACVSVLLALPGCTTISRDAFLAAHSLEHFLSDRPEAASLLREHLILQEWLRSQWVRPIGEYRIFWSNERPTISTAEHGYIPDTRLIVIRISSDLSAADQLTALCFEICNAQAFSDIEELAALAIAGSVSREDYIETKSRREFDAVLRTRSIIREQLPLPEKDQRSTNLYRHLIEAPDEYFAYQAKNEQLPDSNYARTLQFYGMEYDQLSRRGNRR